MRVAEYTFRAQLADRWRDRRVFLLGDAAHLTPPFVGQGLCAGSATPSTSAWKLAGVLDGSLPGDVLDSYEAERKPHARAMIRLAKLVGTAMTQGGELGNLLRRRLVPMVHLLPGLRRRILDGETPALHRSSLVVGPRLRRTLAGRLCPNAVVDGDQRLDEIVAGRFAVITTDPVSPGQRAEVERRGALCLTAPAGTDLHRWLRRGRAGAVLVRPDGTVAQVGRALSELYPALPEVSPRHARAIGHLRDGGSRRTGSPRCSTPVGMQYPRP